MVSLIFLYVVLLNFEPPHDTALPDNPVARLGELPTREDAGKAIHVGAVELAVRHTPELESVRRIAALLDSEAVPPSGDHVSGALGRAFSQSCRS